MSWENNPYYNPESLGLAMVDSIDVAGPWEFDIFAVWTDGSHLYWANDSGCSCPTPFDGINSISDLCVGSLEDCRRAIEEWAGTKTADIMRFSSRLGGVHA